VVPCNADVRSIGDISVLGMGGLEICSILATRRAVDDARLFAVVRTRPRDAPCRKQVHPEARVGKR
jgi:hypothetical protein